MQDTLFMQTASAVGNQCGSGLVGPLKGSWVLPIRLRYAPLTFGGLWLASSWASCCSLSQSIGITSATARAPHKQWQSSRLPNGRDIRNAHPINENARSPFHFLKRSQIASPVSLGRSSIKTQISESGARAKHSRSDTCACSGKSGNPSS